MAGIAPPATSPSSLDDLSGRDTNKIPVGNLPTVIADNSQQTTDGKKAAPSFRFDQTISFGVGKLQFELTAFEIYGSLLMGGASVIGQIIEREREKNRTLCDEAKKNIHMELANLIANQKLIYQKMLDDLTAGTRPFSPDFLAVQKTETQERIERLHEMLFVDLPKYCSATEYAEIFSKVMRTTQPKPPDDFSPSERARLLETPAQAYISPAVDVETSQSIRLKVDADFNRYTQNSTAASSETLPSVPAFAAAQEVIGGIGPTAQKTVNSAAEVVFGVATSALTWATAFTNPSQHVIRQPEPWEPRQNSLPPQPDLGYAAVYAPQVRATATVKSLANDIRSWVYERSEESLRYLEALEGNRAGAYVYDPLRAGTYTAPIAPSGSAAGQVAAPIRAR